MIDPAAERILQERFGKDSVIALATLEDGRPSARFVNAYYEGGAFVEGEAALARAITELVPPFLRPLAELFASYRIY